MYVITYIQVFYRLTYLYLYGNLLTKTQILSNNLRDRRSLDRMVVRFNWNIVKSGVQHHNPTPPHTHLFDKKKKKYFNY